MVKDTYRVKVRDWKKICYANGNDKKGGVAKLTSDKIDFKTKAIKKDKKGHSIVTKRSTYEEDIILINKYTPNINDTNELIYKTETDSQT